MTTNLVDVQAACPRCGHRSAVSLLSALSSCGRCGLLWKVEPREARRAHDPSQSVPAAAVAA
jgi:ribosomal protein S27AE